MRLRCFSRYHNAVFEWSEGFTYWCHFPLVFLPFYFLLSFICLLSLLHIFSECCFNASGHTLINHIVKSTWLFYCHGGQGLHDRDRQVHEWGENGAWHWQVDCCRVSSNVDIVLNHCGEDGAEPEGKAWNLLVSLCSNPHLWSWALGSDQKNKTANTCGWIEFPPWSGQAQPWRYGTQFGHPEGDRSRATAPLRGQLRWFGHFIRMPPSASMAGLWTELPGTWEIPRLCSSLRLLVWASVA